MGKKFQVATEFTANDKGLIGFFKKAGKQADRFGDKSNSAFKKASRSGSRFRDITRGILAADILKTGFRSVVDFGKQAIKLASQLTEVQNVVDTTFGKSAETINKWSKTAITQFGLSELQAKQFNGTLGAMLKSSDISGDALTSMSTDMVGLAGDFASFFDLPVDVAFEKIRSGIIGNTEPLMALGINMQVASLQAFALSKGITKSFKSMTQAEKTTLRYNFLMEKAKDAQGDFNKTLSTSFANQQRVFGTKIKQMSADIAKRLLPALIGVFKFFNRVIDKINVDKVGEVIAGIVPIARGVFSIFKGIFKVVKFLSPAIIIAVKAIIAYNVAMKVFLILGAVGKVLAITKAWFALSLMIGKVKTAQLLLNTAMRANPIGVLISALIIGVPLVLKFGDAINNLFDTLSLKGENIKQVFDGIRTVLRSIPGAAQLIGGNPALDALRQQKLRREKEAPNAKQANAKAANGQVDVNFNNAPAGMTAKTKRQKNLKVNSNMIGANP